MNPDTSKETLPVLLRPTPPPILESSSDPDNPIDLYRIHYQRYTADIEKYKTLQLFMTRIQETVSTNVLSYTINYCHESPRNTLELPEGRQDPRTSQKEQRYRSHPCTLLYRVKARTPVTPQLIIP